MNKYLNVVNLLKISGIMLTCTVAMLVYSSIIKKKIKSNGELTNYETDIKALNNKIKNSKKELQDIINKFQKLKSEADNQMHYYGDRLVDGWAPNVAFDENKAKEFKKQKDEYRDLVNHYILVKKDLAEAKKGLKEAKNNLYKLARKFKIGESDYIAIENKINTLFEKMDEIKREIESVTESVNIEDSIFDAYIEGVIDENMMNSMITILTEDTSFNQFKKSINNVERVNESSVVDIKIAIYESELSGEITAEERDMLIKNINEKSELMTEWGFKKNDKKEDDYDFMKTGVMFKNIDIEISKMFADDSDYEKYKDALKKDIRYLSKAFDECINKIKKEGKVVDETDLVQIIYNISTDFKNRRFLLVFHDPKSIIDAFVIIENNKYYTSVSIQNI